MTNFDILVLRNESLRVFNFKKGYRLDNLYCLATENVFAQTVAKS